MAAKCLHHLSVVRDLCQYVLLWVLADGMDYFGKTLLVWLNLIVWIKWGC